MNKVFIITQGPFYYTKTGEYHIGGIQTYIRRLIDIFVEVGYRTYVINDGIETLTVQLENNATYVQVPVEKDRVRALVKRAEQLGDIQNDLLLFSTSTEIMPSRFKHVLGIQHGIYWDSSVVRGVNLKNYISMAVLRSLQTVQQIKWHRTVGTLVCVDANYVNWLRACAGDFNLDYVYIPNFAEVPRNKKKNSSGSNINILFARRFVKQRGIELLIDALPTILDKYPHTTLTIAGQGEGLSKLHATFDNYGERVCFTQYDANDSVDFHLNYDIALVPSLYSEGTSLSLLEAMSAGCACIATDVGGLSNIIINGHNGILIRPRSSDLVKALSKVIDNKDERLYLANNAMQTVKDSFSIEVWKNRWIDFINSYYPANDKPARKDD